jgi:hypothetical protein
MSHWTKVKTKITSLESLKKALERMGLEVNEGSHTISQYGKSEKAEVKVDNSVGFSMQKDGTWAMVGDFYHSRNPILRKYYGRNKNFEQDLNTAYAVADAVAKLEDQQFFCTENEGAEVGEDGFIRMTFERI